MVRFAVVGTSKIVSEFLSCARTMPDVCLQAGYSRDYDRGAAFARRYACAKVYTDLDELGRDSEIDAVYIASPNACHCAQSIQLMGYGKHVLCEKPLAANSREVQAMIAAARQHDVLFMEAMKTPFMPVYQNIKRNLATIGKVRRVFFNYSQYSSRYDKFRNGIIENAFKRELANGALMDIGVYPLCAMLDIFGPCQEISACAQLLHTGVDGLGTVAMQYADFIGNVHYAKVCNSLVPSEIQGEDGNILIEGISVCDSAKLVMRDGRTIDLGTERRDAFYYETREFLDLIAQGEKQSLIMPHQLSMELMTAMDEIRRYIGLVYPTDS